MRLTLLYGRSGSGKTHTVTEEIGDVLRAGRSVLLLCPEQEAVIAERRMTARFGGVILTENLEISNFGRLPERVFREYGGLTAQQLSTGGRRLMMHRAMADCQPVLREYGRCVDDEAMVDRLLRAVAEFKMFCVPPSDVEEISQALPAGYRNLSDKLADLSVLYAAYEMLLHREYHDPEDALDALYAVLERSRGAFFADRHIYLDGFNGFTAQQYRIIRQMIAHGAHVTVTLGCDAPSADREPEWMLRRICETDRTLRRIARDIGVMPQIRALHENRRAASPSLRYLCENLWKSGPAPEADGASVPRDGGGHVRVFACDTPFSEAEAIAQDICRYVRQGGRYRDVTVMTRGVERCEGVLDAALEKYGIPCGISRRTPVLAKPFFRYLRHLIALCIWGFARQDVIGLLKTGCSSVAQDEAFIYENYITTWNLTGRRLMSEDEYTMHPDGYVAQYSEEALERLSRVNAVREQICTEYLPFCEDFLHADTTVRARAERLYRFLCEQEMPARLLARAKTERAHGALAAAGETEQLWDIFVDALDTLVMIEGAHPCTAQSFWQLLSMTVSDLDIGTIPAREDEVVIGDASLLRADRARRVYLIGAADGVFPAAPTEDALLSDHERSILSGLGLTLSADTAAQLQDEMFHFWFAAAAASEQLVVTYPRADLSGKAFRIGSGAERILAMFPDLRTEDPTLLPPYERLCTPETAFELMAYDRQSPFGAALFDYYTRCSLEDEVLKRKLLALTQPLTVRKNRLREDTLALLFGDTMSMTQSRLEQYVLCHFAYFCGYVLKLRPQKRAEFGAADIGSFVHDVLRGFMEQYRDAEDKTRFDDESVLTETVSDLVASYLDRVCGMKNGDAQPQRIRHLFRRLTAQAVVIARNLTHEFAQSDFVPRDFELPIGADDGGSVPALTVRTPDGTRVRLYGTVDRVDTYEHDGKTYIRVVDYKTYVKRFSREDVAAGLNMQLLLYLFAVWKKGGGRYGGELHPAGVLYMGSQPSQPVCKGIPMREEVLSAAESGMTRSGLFLDEREVLEAMERGLGGKYIPIKVKADGTLRSGAPVINAEGFDSLLRDVERTVSDIAAEMKSGNADALPISKTHPDRGRDPCAYCDMKYICRN
ncbi:MAG: PD-(D/E)XK nuclease family protein [Clostridia bacterium]|nr:PD-(D/E)XK nuclease family protein [Clostridia bacterium]